MSSCSPFLICTLRYGVELEVISRLEREAKLGGQLRFKIKTLLLLLAHIEAQRMSQKMQTEQ